MYGFQQCIIYLKTDTFQARFSMYGLMYKKSVAGGGFQ
ncbi:hypothetical protein J2X87_004090 [Pseudomonas synxantha]|uniref:Uncharacterized protein n=1 Tax=Pseudomonas synxantha TaxID=47883 RepID=A0ACC6JR19_9PSED|nr:hypothetical protein [Pseudomonas synxantha]